MRETETTAQEKSCGQVYPSYSTNLRKWSLVYTRSLMGLNNRKKKITQTHS